MCMIMVLLLCFCFQQGETTEGSTGNQDDTRDVSVSEDSYN